MKKSFLNIIPRKKAGFYAELTDCIEQSAIILKGRELEKDSVVKIAAFIRVERGDDFVAKKLETLNQIKVFFNDCIPPTGVIAQPPSDGFSVSMELHILNGAGDIVKIEKRQCEGINYIVVDYGDYREIIASGISYCGEEPNALNCSEGAFGAMYKILKNEGLRFSDVVRQWNYIENITGITPNGDSKSQNYQVFNDVRSKFYSVDDWRDGYPAATGIGMNCGGVSIDFIAVTPLIEFKVIPLKNPKQVDAHQYTEEVLVGEAITNCGKKTSPKFERGKLIHKNCSGIIYVSGTAAIRGQEAIVGCDAAAQTAATIENIKELVSKENINAGCPDNNFGEAKFVHLRVYVKREKDIPIVGQICESNFPGIPAIYVVADICRESLLVEIEGILEIG